MKLTEYVKKVIQNFFIIFASIIIILTILRQFYYPEMSFDLMSIYTIMTFSLIGALTGFILYSPHTISEKNMRKRIIIHFLSLEMILISMGAIFGIVNNFSNLLLLAFEIAVIYFIIRLLSWQNNKKVAEEINEKLKSFKKDMEE
jgi:hypothetical protein